MITKEPSISSSRDKNACCCCSGLSGSPYIMPACAPLPAAVPQERSVGVVGGTKGGANAAAGVAAGRRSARRAQQRIPGAARAWQGAHRRR